MSLKGSVSKPQAEDWHSKTDGRAWGAETGDGRGMWGIISAVAGLGGMKSCGPSQEKV